MQHSHPKKSPRLRRILVALSAVSAFFLLTLLLGVLRYLFPGALDRTETVTVPDLVGKSTALTESLDPARFQIIRIEQYSKEQAGTVLAQNPPPGSIRKHVKGLRFVTLTLTVSKGQHRATVPHIVGLSESDARAALLSAGFVPTVTRIYRKRPIGEAVSQSIPSGTSLPVGTEIAIEISRGEALPLVRIPNLSGLSAVRAVSLMESLGLKTGRITFEIQDGDENRVLMQSPLPFGSVPQGARIDLVLSRKPIAPPAPVPEPSEDTDSGTSTAESTEELTDPKAEESTTAPSEPPAESPEERIHRIFESLFPSP